MLKLPDDFLEKMKNLLGDEYPEFLQTYDQPRTAGLRANRIKISTVSLERKIPFVDNNVPWCEDGFYYDDRLVRPAKNPYFYAGLYYVQEPSAMLPAELLDVHPSDKVLDLCAAPGGKSVQLAGKLSSDGVLVTNDINPNRARVLLKNIERYGIINAIVLNETPQRIARVFRGYFDKILVDAPCSGEGMFRKEPDMVKGWSEQEVLKYARWQADILNCVPEMLKPNGDVVYSTCTFSREENEEQLAGFLKEYNNFQLLKVHRIWPHKAVGEGHFAARMKGGAENYNTCEIVNKEPAVSSKAVEALEDFSMQVWHDRGFWRRCLPDSGVVVERDGHILWEKAGVPPLKGLKVLRSGWLVGVIEKGRFKPSQAFAMGLGEQAVKAVVQRLDFDADSEQDRYMAIRYLRGETIQRQEGEWPKGWHLITIDNYPLGWAKGAGFILKNEYPPGWRWQDKDEG